MTLKMCYSGSSQIEGNIKNVGVRFGWQGNVSKKLAFVPFQSGDLLSHV